MAPDIRSHIEIYVNTGTQHDFSIYASRPARVSPTLCALSRLVVSESV